MTNSQEHLVFVSFVEGTPEEREARIAKFFRGDAASWSSLRFRRLGDVIIPKHACFSVVGNPATVDQVRPHGTYFVEHTYLDPRSEEKHHIHHIVCDCAAKRKLTDSQGKVNLDACPELKLVARLRARRFGKDIDKTRAALVERNDQTVEVMFADQNLVLSAIETTLMADKVAPDSWPGTIVSGRLEIDQAIEITGQPAEEVVWAAQFLHDAGHIEFDGQSMQLAA